MVTGKNGNWCLKIYFEFRTISNVTKPAVDKIQKSMKFRVQQNEIRDTWFRKILIPKSN